MTFSYRDFHCQTWAVIKLSAVLKLELAETFLVQFEETKKMSEFVVIPMMLLLLIHTDMKHAILDGV